MHAGARNLITDVSGVLVGNAHDVDLGTGSTVVTSDAPFVAAAHVMGGAPGTRETDLLAPETLVQEVDALCLSGGSGFGIEAGAGVAEGLRAAGRGYLVRGQRVPIVPGAIIMDLTDANAGWTDNPWRGFGRAAFEAAGTEFAIGTAGAGTGASSATLKGGLGSASAVLESGATVGALVAANPIGQVTVGDGPHFLASPWEIGDEFGGLGVAPLPWPDPVTKSGMPVNTVIGIVATDVALTQAQAKRLAMMAHDGIARAVQPSHTPFDGDLIFAAATGRRQADDADLELVRLGHAAACCVARSIARAIYEASPAPGAAKPTWAKRFG